MLQALSRLSGWWHPLRCGVPLLGALPFVAAAQAFPVKSIRMVVPFAAGGTADVLGRLLAPRASVPIESASRRACRRGAA